jgi:hypothetical protein
VYLSVQKLFLGLYPGPPLVRGGEGMQEGGWIIRNGRKGMGSKERLTGREGGEGGEEGRGIVKAGAPKTKFWLRHYSQVY